MIDSNIVEDGVRVPGYPYVLGEPSDTYVCQNGVCGNKKTTPKHFLVTDHLLEHRRSGDAWDARWLDCKNHPLKCPGGVLLVENKRQGRELEPVYWKGVDTVRIVRIPIYDDGMFNHETLKFKLYLHADPEYFRVG